MKQTAVDWLFAELKNHLDMPSHHANEILEQAKEMEKEQIEDAFIVRYSGTAEEYYNETFNTNEK
jgi:phosphoenolpyruvate synthase/pyruvate phosphate dikinase